MSATLAYIAAGGNRHPSAADWAPGLLAFGAGNNVALWDPNNKSQRGINALLTGHSDVVNAVKICDTLDRRIIITGSADKTIRIWAQSALDQPYEELQCLSEHSGSINTISVLPKRHVFATGTADGTIKIFELAESEAKLVESISIQPRCLPLTCALTELDDGSIVLAVAGTSNSIYVYTRIPEGSKFELQTSLIGHEGWVRSLDFVTKDAGVMLASASQDKYLRLWRIQKKSLTTRDSTHPPSLKKALSNKAHEIGSSTNRYVVTFEALLIGHEDWVHTARWNPRGHDTHRLQLLSASADNSLAIWEADESSGVWICRTRLGEISSQKGSTTATGSTGGFWMGLWAPLGEEVMSLGRTGSWRRWKYDQPADMWPQQLGISGHTREVKGVAWSPDGSYLITTGSDQTTRLFAEWKRDGESSWHEFARPQIHGYDLNCIDTLNPNRFISGADEKLLRVFDKPRAVSNILSKLSGMTSGVSDMLPDAANIPVLGLSNKAIAITAEDVIVNGDADHMTNGEEAVEDTVGAHKSQLELDHPPFEEHLARRTLWPEHEKLYGHGYEISAVAASHDGLLVATACKASSIDHAVIRLYETREWREVKPPLSAHSLTVTALDFSTDDQYLLSVGRDRQWAIFQRDAGDTNTFTILRTDPKAHSRMVLDCSWGPGNEDRCFATASRDKSVKIWRLQSPQQVDCVATIKADSAVTSVVFDNSSEGDHLRLAYGTEDGEIHIAHIQSDIMELVSDLCLSKATLPSGTINALRWRPPSPTNAFAGQLAVVSDDVSLRIFDFER